MANVPNGAEILPKISSALVGCTSVTDDGRQTHGRATSAAPAAVRWLPSAACGASPLFDVRSSGRAFSVAVPAAWNSLPDQLRDPRSSVNSFRRDLKTFLSRSTSLHSALRALRLCAI